MAGFYYNNQPKSPLFYQTFHQNQNYIDKSFLQYDINFTTNLI